MRSMHLGSAFAAATLAIAFHASRAEAAGPSPEGAPTEVVARERPATRSFYGWQILATGGAGGVVAAASTVIPDSPMKTLPSTVGFLVGMPFYVLGGPATHWTHGDFQKGLISLGANFTLPVVSGLIGQGVSCGANDAPGDCGSRGFFTGFAIALVAVPVIDALVLGWEDIPDDDPVVTVAPRTAEESAAPSSTARASRRRAPKLGPNFTMVPAWSVGPKGELGFGVSGRF